MCNVLAPILGEKKKARSSEEVSQSKLVRAVPGEMEAVGQAHALSSRCSVAWDKGRSYHQPSRIVGASHS